MSTNVETMQHCTQNDVEPFFPEVIVRMEAMDRSWMSKRESYYLDLFLVSYYTGGATIAEMGTFRHGQIKSDWLYDSKRRIRPLADACYQILEKYDDDCYADYLLPIFTYKHIVDTQKDDRAKRISKGVNSLMKRVSRELELEEDLTIKSTRKIFVEHAIRGRVRFDYISNITGLSIETIVRHYENIKDELTV